MISARLSGKVEFMKLAKMDRISFNDGQVPVAWLGGCSVLQPQGCSFGSCYHSEKNIRDNDDDDNEIRSKCSLRGKDELPRRTTQYVKDLRYSCLTRPKFLALTIHYPPSVGWLGLLEQCNYFLWSPSTV